METPCELGISSLLWKDNEILHGIEIRLLLKVYFREKNICSLWLDLICGCNFSHLLCLKNCIYRQKEKGTKDMMFIDNLQMDKFKWPITI